MSFLRGAPPPKKNPGSAPELEVIQGPQYKEYKGPFMYKLSYIVLTPNVVRVT